MTSAYSDKACRLFAMLGDAENICIVVHSHPDGDALGCSAALCRFAREKLAKDCTVIIPDAGPQVLDFVHEGLGFINAGEDSGKAEATLARADLIVCMDMNAFDRAGSLEGMLLRSNAVKVLIDHHLNPDEKSFDLTISEKDISSASELLYWVLLGMPGMTSAADLPLKCAEALMTGMTTDTNNFANSVFPSTLSMASDLLSAGVDRDKLLTMIYNRYGESRIRAMGFFLDRKLRITEDGVAYMVIKREEYEACHLCDGDTEGFVNIPLAIGKVRLSLFLKEDNGYYRVSIRSKKGTSAAGLARQYFNGGGHECASGGKLFFPADIPDRDDAEDYIENVTARFLHKDKAA